MLPDSAALCFSSCHFKAPRAALIGQLTHAWAITTQAISGRLCRAAS